MKINFYKNGLIIRKRMNPCKNYLNIYIYYMDNRKESCDALKLTFARQLAKWSHDAFKLTRFSLVNARLRSTYRPTLSNEVKLMGVIRVRKLKWGSNKGTEDEIERNEYLGPLFETAINDKNIIFSLEKYTRYTAKSSRDHNYWTRMLIIFMEHFQMISAVNRKTRPVSS
uniref:Uncharacterized protein n=1 Tax=Heterorhabditis bacteriophora TaxID=37862 RepID=A0A1I7WW68_HETBA